MSKIKNIVLFLLIFTTINIKFFGLAGIEDEYISPSSYVNTDSVNNPNNLIHQGINYGNPKKNSNVKNDCLGEATKCVSEKQKEEESKVTEDVRAAIELIDEFLEIKKENDKLAEDNSCSIGSYAAGDEYYLTHVAPEIKKIREKKIEANKIKMNSLKKQVDDLMKKIDEGVKNLTTTTRTLAFLYSKLETRGDPVDVSTGRFKADYLDFKAHDYFDGFTIKRKYTYGNYKESFGNNWTCSLDSRIVRCIPESCQTDIDDYEKVLNEINSLKNLYNNFKSKYNTTNNTLDSDYEKAQQYEIKCKQILEILYKKEEYRNTINEKNKFVTYGRFANSDNYIGLDNVLFYITDMGESIGFIYMGNGEWTAVSGLALGSVKIKGIDSNGMYSCDDNCDGGYELIFEDNSKKCFSPYGILEKEIDRNLNETIYKSKNGFIYEIILKTGEVIKVERNAKNYITSIGGEISGTSYFLYEGDNLKKVIDNKNIEVSYNYRDDGELDSIIKNNNSRIKLDYEYNAVVKHNVCVGVTNGNNYRESFHFDMVNRVMEHNYYGCGIEVSKFDENGRTVYYSDLHGSVMEIEYDSFGEIITIKQDGEIKKFEYDEKWRPISITYNNGCKDLIFYNDFGFITKIIDRDGFSNTYEYDNRGNMTKSFMGNMLCGTYWYYPNGLLKGYNENNNIVEFKYNKYGKIIEKKEKTIEGEIFISKWKYDDKNNLIEFTDPSGDIFSYEYGDKKEIVTNGNCRTTKIFNERNLIVTEIDEDLYTGEKHIKKNVYDKLDNIIQVYVNGELLSEYEYYRNNLLKSFTVWNNPDKKNKNELFYGIKTEYKYNKNWFKIAEERTKIVNNKESEKIKMVEYKYSNQAKTTVITEKKYLETEKKSTFNESGKLIKEEWADGYFKMYSYSPAGRLTSIKDSNDNYYFYKYSSNGTYKVIYKNAYGGEITYYYDYYGRLEKLSDYYGIYNIFKYDYKGNVVYEKYNNYSVERKFDKKNRMNSYCLKNNKGEIISEYFIKFDDKTNTEYILNNGYVESEKRFNVWGMLKESKEISGHYFYTYDYLGNCRKIKDYYGNETLFEYSPYCDIIQEEYEDGTRKKIEYSLAGFVQKIISDGREDYSCRYGDNFFEYEQLGKINKINFETDSLVGSTEFYDTGEYDIERKNQNCYEVKDSSGDSYKYETDKSGNIIKESNPLGNSLIFEYASDGGIRKKINYSGDTEKYTYDPEKRITTIEYSAGEKVEIEKNELGKIKRISTNNYNLKYEYDKRGNLISEYSDKTGNRINYFYDAYSRCVKKSGIDFDFLYTYDEMSKLTKIEDKKTKSWVCFTYDNLLRVKNKKYSNGMESSYGYNKYGQLEYSITKNKLGILLSGDFLIYDALGRISLRADVGGNVTKYKYDDKGRLISTEYPYSENKRNSFYEEAAECGYYLKSEPSIEKIKLNNFELTALRHLYEKSGINTFVSININQDIWTEKYSYNSNGGINSVKNPFGEIEYKYDKLNRPISKNYKSSDSNGMQLRWNDDNLLEEIVSKKRKISFYYGALKRPVKIIYEDYVDKKCEIQEFRYDGLGRRCFERCNNICIENMYDGLSSVLISRKLVTDNDFLCSPYNNTSEKELNIKAVSSNFTSSSDYRYVDNTKYRPFGEVPKQEEINSNVNKNINPIPNKEDYKSYCENKSCSILSYGTEPILISYESSDSNFSGDTKFLIKDYKKQIVGIVNCYSDFTEYNEFDTWGYNVANNNKKDIFVNLGYRDYIPLLKTFTSEDPARDGKNWFAYCACDSVNYVDSIGLQRQTISNADDFLFQANIFCFLNFNEIDFQDPSKRDRFNRYMSLYGGLDCTDNVMAVNCIAWQKAGLKIKEENMMEFSKLYNSNKFRNAQNVAQSKDFYTGIMGRKVGCGMDSEFFKNSSNISEEDKEKYTYKKKAEKDQALKDLRDPEKLKPGSILVWKNSDYNRSSCPKSCGHSAVVLSRKFDSNGNIVGFVVLEGHTNGEKTELNYIDVSKGNTDVYLYKGEFAGIYELEDKETSKVENICVI